MSAAINGRSVPHIVVVGGGAGGIELVTRLARTIDMTRARITLVDESPLHFWKPRLHEIAAGLIGAGDEQVSFLAHAARCGFTFELGRFVGLDRASRTIRVAAVTGSDPARPVLPERCIGYDLLVLGFGSRVNDFGTPGVSEHCHVLDRPDQAAALQKEIFEAALRAGADAATPVRIGIVGAGATGVELAAELHHAFADLRRFGGIDAGKQLRITLVDMAKRVLPATDVRTSAFALQTLETIGVDVRLGVGVQKASSAGYLLSDGTTVPCEIRVWAAGITGTDAVDRLDGLPLSRDRRILVDARLACEGATDIYAIGDCAFTPAKEGHALPPTAQVAHQQASYLASALRQRLIQREAPAFTFHPKGTLVSLGRAEAAAEIPNLRANRPAHSMRGVVAKLLYVSLEHMHRAAIYGWSGAIALFMADWLRGTRVPPVKLH